PGRGSPQDHRSNNRNPKGRRGQPLSSLSCFERAQFFSRNCQTRPLAAGARRRSMFARTTRLLLRPGWAEDAPALAQAIADEMIVRNLASAPWPFTLRDAEAFLAAPRDPILPSLLI